MRNSWRVAIVGAALSALAALAVAPTVAAADPVYGVSTDRALSSKDLAEIERGGVKVLRLEISWGKTKGKGGKLNWRRSDTAVRRAAEHGLDVVPYLTGTPRWIKPGGPEPNPEKDGWLQFVTGAVDRYGPGGTEQISNPIETWQVWNTANQDSRRSSPKSYGELLEATHRAIKLADPGADVLTGALSFARKAKKPAPFLRHLLNLTARNSFSAVAVSPMAGSVGGVKKQLKDIRKALEAGDRGDEGIWVTPIGWASDRRSSKAMSVGIGGQKKRLKQSVKALRKNFGVEGVLWSRWRDGGGGCKWCRHSGLVRKNGKSKPAWKAYKKFLKTLGTGPPPPPPPPADASFFGVVPEYGGLTGADLSYMDAAGVGAVRFIVHWQLIQGANGQFNWGKVDAEFEKLALHGIAPLPQLYGNESQVTNVENAGVMNRWRAFVAAAVNRYKAGSPFWDSFEAEHPGYTPVPPKVWQVYNEQNIRAFWPSGPSPNKYAVLLDYAAAAIRAADPSAKIMLGGMHGDDEPMDGTKSWDFLNGLYAYPGASDDFDIVAVHPYRFDVDGIEREMDTVRDVMVTNGDAASPIWVSEMSWSSELDPNNVRWYERTPQGQADMLTAAWNLLLDNRAAWNLQGVFWYTWRDPTAGGLCTFCASAGLLEENYMPKPSFSAFRQIAQAGVP